MDDFSWTDGLRAALKPCLSCFVAPEEDGASDSNEGPRQSRGARSHSSTHHNDLEGLLRDPEETDVDAETWSLHSNVGRQRKKKGKGGKKRSAKKSSSSSFFSSYFGRGSTQAIRLPESDSEDDTPYSNSLARSNSSSTSVSHSSATFDSDAASLDAAAIAKLSAQEALLRAEAAARAREEMERVVEEAKREKAEAKQRRKERRELRRASQLIAMGVDDMPSDAFEYLQQQQQQQQGYSPAELPPSAYLTAPHPSAGYAPIPADFTLAHAQQQPPRVRVAAANNNMLNVPNHLAGVIEEEHDDGDAHTDFGGEVYTIKTRKSKSNLRGVHGSDAGSSSSRSSRSHATATTATSSSSTTSAGDPSTIAYQRFLAMAALNGGQAALAALPSPSTPALSLSPSSAGFNSGAEQPSFAEEDVVPSFADPPKRKKKRRPETWIAPSSSSPHTLVFDPQSIKTPPARLSPGVTQDGVGFQYLDAPNGARYNSSLGLEVSPNIDLQGGLANARRKKKNRMSMSGAL